MQNGGTWWRGDSLLRCWRCSSTSLSWCLSAREQQQQQQQKRPGIFSRLFPVIIPPLRMDLHAIIYFCSLMFIQCAFLCFPSPSSRTSGFWHVWSCVEESWGHVGVGHFQPRQKATSESMKWKYWILPEHLVEARLREPIGFAVSSSQILLLVLIKGNIVCNPFTIQPVAGGTECSWSVAMIHSCLRGSFCPTEVDEAPWGGFDFTFYYQEEMEMQSSSSYCIQKAIFNLI